MPSFTTACAEAALTTKSVPPQPLQQRLQRLAQSGLNSTKLFISAGNLAAPSLKNAHGDVFAHPALSDHR